MTQLKIRNRTVTSPYFRKNKRTAQSYEADDTDIDTVIYYPRAQQERDQYINPKTHHKITPFQYRVYDLVAQIPKGHVTTYKVLSDTLKSAPRAVGQALRVNPFCPNPVPCHRVIASDYSIGGFSGHTGDCVMASNKKAKLMAEGCVFDDESPFVLVRDIEGSVPFDAFIT